MAIKIQLTNSELLAEISNFICLYIIHILPTSRSHVPICYTDGAVTYSSVELSIWLLQHKDRIVNIFKQSMFLLFSNRILRYKKQTQ